MKIIKEPEIAKDKAESLNIICDNCQAELEITKDDCVIGWNGWYVCKCPCCGDNIYPEEWDVYLDETNVEYPLHFRGKDENVCRLSDERIQNTIRKLIKEMKKSPDCDYMYSATGDTMVFALNLSGDNEIKIIVAKDIEECSIPI